MRKVWAAFGAPLSRGIFQNSLRRVPIHRLFQGSKEHSYPCRLAHSGSYCRVDASHISAELSSELESARNEARPYRIDRSKLTNQEWEEIRKRSRQIPMVADPDPLDVVHEDENFLIVNKPSYVKMHPAHRFEGGSLLNRAIGYLGYTPWLMHRLDMHTTGVVVMTKKKKLCKPIMQQFMKGRVRKEYLCVVDGVRDDSIGNSFVVDAPIQRHDVKFMREVGATKADSKAARTMYTMMQISKQAKMMLLRAEPQTGRTHQIRLHAKECGHPIVGDDLYNPLEYEMYSSAEEITLAARNENLARYGDGNPLRKNLKLHAWKIQFCNPVDGQIISFCAPPPRHLTDLLEWAGMEVPGE